MAGVARSTALRAGAANNMAASSALPAGAADLQKALLVQHLAAPMTNGAGDQPIVLLRAGSLAAAAGVHARNLDIDAEAAYGVLEVDLEIVAQVFTALGAIAAAPATTAEQV